MIAGFFISVLLCGGDPASLPAAPGWSESHKEALARYGAAVWNLRHERLLTAAKQLEAAAKADPEAVEPKRELVKLYAQLGREPEAIRLARKLLANEADDPETAILLARLLFDAGETKESLGFTKRAIQSKLLAKQPAKALRIYRDAAALCEKANDLAEAEQALRKAVEIVVDKRAAVIAVFAFTPKEADSEAADCLERLGRVLVKRSKNADAAETFQAAAKLYADPKKADDAAAALRLAWNLTGVLEAEGEPTAALKQLEQYLKLQPHSPEPYQRLARLLRAAGRERDIVPALSKYAERDKLNHPLAAVLAAEMALVPSSRRTADDLFATIAETTTDPVVIAVIVKSHLATHRPIEIIQMLDRSFAALKDDGEKEKPASPKSAAAKTFAAELARAIAESLEKEPDAVAALLRAAADDLKEGNKRAHGTYYFLGSLAQRHRKLDVAIVQFRQAVRVAPQATHVEAYSALVQALWLAGKTEAVATLCREAVGNRNVNVAEVFFSFHLALALAEMGKAEEAIAAADKAILQAADTDRLLVRLRKHRVLCVLGQWADAIEYGNKLLEEFDTAADRPKVRYAQASAYWGAKKPAEAEKLLRAVLDDDPDNAVVCNDLGYHLADQGRKLNEAEQLIRHAITVDRIDRRKAGSAEPENAAYIDSLGWVLFRQGKLADAKALLEKAAALPSGEIDPVVWDHLGDVHFRMNDKKQAKAAWEKARELYEADARLSSRGRRDGRLDEVNRKLHLTP